MGSETKIPHFFFKFKFVKRKETINTKKSLFSPNRLTKNRSEMKIICEEYLNKLFFIGTDLLNES